jgi:pyruvate kinase
VIVATQVLESMTVEPRPTRAEVNDAANAVDDGVDGIMLSGESAVGKFPIKAIETLSSIIVEAEAAPLRAAAPPSEAAGDHAQAICEAAVTLANRGDAQALVAVTRSGGTARRLAALRPRAPIIAVSESGETARRLALYWGVLPVGIPFGDNLETAAPMIARELVSRGIVARGLPVVVVNISPDLGQSDANYLKMRLL